MCYSAQIWQQYRRYVRAYDSKIDIETFVELFWSRLQDDRIKIPKALEEAFSTPENEPEQRIERLAELDAILDDRERPYCEHRLAA